MFNSHITFWSYKMWSPSTGGMNMSFYKTLYKNVVLISNWWTFKSNWTSNANIIPCNFYNTWFFSPKSMLKTWLKPHATKQAQMYFFTPPSTLYLILKTHLQVIGFLSLGNSMSVQVLFFCKKFNSKSMSFLQCKNSSLSKTFNMDWGFGMCA